MRESLVNIFVYGDGKHVHAVGWHVYEKAGSYEELTKIPAIESAARPSERPTRRTGETNPEA